MQTFLGLGNRVVLESPQYVTRPSVVSEAAQSARQTPRDLLLRLVALRAIVTIAAAALAKLVYIDLFLGQSQGWLPYLWPPVLLAFILHTMFREARFNELETLLSQSLNFGPMCGAIFRSVLILIGLLFLLKLADFYSRGWFIAWAVTATVGLIGVQWFMMRRAETLARSGSLRRCIAMIGTPEYVSALSQQIREQGSGYDVTALSYADGGDEDVFQSELDALKSSIERGFYDHVLVCGPSERNPIVYRAVCLLSSCATELLLCTELKPSAIRTAGQREIGGIAVRVVNLVPLSEQSWLVKRFFDVAVAGLGLVLLSPILLAVALLIKLDSPGPVFFRQRRFGRNNRVFRIFKFRTMTVTEDGDRVVQATRGDARVTRVGRFLRATSIDELPQLLNVLQGSMSIVGPRPHALAHDIEFEKSLDLFASRRRVRPGLTGWAQVNGYRGEIRSQEDIRRRMDHDLHYVENWSIWVDLEIVVRTVVTVLRGAY